MQFLKCPAFWGMKRLWVASVPLEQQQKAERHRKGGLFLMCFMYFIPSFTTIFSPKEYQSHLATKDPCS